MNDVTQLPKQSLIEQEQKSTCDKWQDLPTDLWETVLEYASVKDRIACMAVSRYFRAAAKDENFWSKVIREKLEPNELEHVCPFVKLPLDSETSFHCVASFFSPSELAADRSIRHIFFSRLGLSTLARAYEEAEKLKSYKGYLSPGLYPIISYIVSEHINNKDFKAAKNLCDQVELDATRHSQMVSRYASVKMSYIRNHCKEGQLKEAMDILNACSLNHNDWFVAYSIVWIHLDTAENKKQIPDEALNTIEDKVKEGLKTGVMDRRRRPDCISVLARESYTPSQLAHMQKFVREHASDLINDKFDVIQFNILIRDLDEAWEKTLDLPVYSKKRRDALSMMINVFKRAGKMEQAELAATYLKDESPSNVMRSKK